MKKFTQEEFDALPRDNHGIKLCPSGDYTAVTVFGERCSFGKFCSFGEWCSFGKGCGFGDGCSFGKGCGFGERCSFGEGCGFGESCRCEFGEFTGLIAAGGFGSYRRTTYFFLLTDGNIGVRCGCFAGLLPTWERKVKETHGDTRIAKAYLALIPAVQLQFGIEE